jgi:hypothetical protein
MNLYIGLYTEEYDILPPVALRQLDSEVLFHNGENLPNSYFKLNHFPQRGEEFSYLPNTRPINFQSGRFLLRLLRFVSIAVSVLGNFDFRGCSRAKSIAGAIRPQFKLCGFRGMLSSKHSQKSHLSSRPMAVLPPSAFPHPNPRFDGLWN